MHSRSSNMDDTELVPSCDGGDCGQSIQSSKTYTVTYRIQEDTSLGQQTCSNGLSVVRKFLQEQKVSSRATNIIMASWRQGTQKQYNMYIKKWFYFCDKRKISKFQTSVEVVLEFLTELYEQRLSYSAINTACSSLSAIGLVIEHFTAGSHPLVIRFMKGVYNMKPQKSRYCKT